MRTSLKTKLPLPKQRIDAKDALPSVNAATLAELLDLSRPRVVKMTSEGIISQPVDGKYSLPCAVVEYIRHSRQKTLLKDELMAEQIERTKRQSRHLDFDLKVKENEFQSTAEVCAEIGMIGEAMKGVLQAELERLPTICAGLPAVEQRIHTRKIFVAVLKKWQEWARKFEPEPGDAKAA